MKKPKTEKRRKKKDSFLDDEGGEEWNENIQNEWNEIIYELKQPKLKNMALPPPPQEKMDPAKCLEMLDDAALKNELEKRRLKREEIQNQQEKQRIEMITKPDGKVKKRLVLL